MRDYVIVTDSGCDIKPALLKEWGVESCNLTFRFVNDDKEYSNSDMSVGEFYDRMRLGGVAKTAAVNSQSFATKFEQIVKQGNDVIYIGFSSGLSTTYNSARIAAQQTLALYPDAKIYTVDTLAASAGQGLIVKLTVDKKNDGASVEEAYEFAKEISPRISHWFTVDDLVYLKRGGRISPAAAFFGNVIGIKPVLHVDDEGHLVNVAKVRGRKSAVMALAEKLDALMVDKENGKIYISHADCLNDANELANIFLARYGARVEVITDVGPVIGAHAGPGTLALFFVGKER